MYIVCTYILTEAVSARGVDGEVCGFFRLEADSAFEHAWPFVFVTRVRQFAKSLVFRLQLGDFVRLGVMRLGQTSHERFDL